MSLEDVGLIRVGPIRYRVDQKRKLDEFGTLGSFDHDSAKIVLRQNLDWDIEREILTHEVLHSITQAAGLQNHKHEELFVTSLAPHLLDVLQRNPRLIAYLVEE